MTTWFGTAGIRGTYLDDVTPDLATLVGKAITAYLKARKIALGGDARTTTPLLKYAAAVGAMYIGSDVIDLGLIPMPVLPWWINRGDSDGGIYITASHNPPTDNGIKVFDGEGREFTRSMEEELESLMKKGSFKPASWREVGTLTRQDPLREYIDELVSFDMPENPRISPRVLVDTANGPSALVTPHVLRSLGADVITFNSAIDGYFPGRTPEPRPDVLEPYLPSARELGVHVFLAHDGDGDRLAVLDPLKGFIKQDHLIALLAKEKLSQRKGTIIVSIDVGNAVRDVVHDMGGKLEVVRLGKIHEGLITNPSALMAAEPWKLIDPSWGPWIDGMHQASLIVKMIIERGKKIGELMNTVPNYPQARYSIKVPRGIRDAVYEALVNKVKQLDKGKGKVQTIDGYRLDLPNKTWVLVRKSGTEPKVRIYAEAKKPSTLENLVNELIKEAKKAVSPEDRDRLIIEGKIIY